MCGRQRGPSGVRVGSFLEPASQAGSGDRRGRGLARRPGGNLRAHRGFQPKWRGGGGVPAGAGNRFAVDTGTKAVCLFLGRERWSSSPEQTGVGTLVFPIGPSPEPKPRGVCALGRIPAPSRQDPGLSSRVRCPQQDSLRAPTLWATCRPASAPSRPLPPEVPLRVPAVACTHFPISC